MPRPNTGPKLAWNKERGIYYVRWYERGAKKVKSTGTADQREAEDALSRFIDRQRGQGGPRQPHEVDVAEALAFYGEHRGPQTADPARIGQLIEGLLVYWEDKTLGQITENTCLAFAERRKRSPGTIRRELGLLTAAQNFMVQERLLTASVPVKLPAKPDPKDRWLTRAEAARLLNTSRHLGRETRQYLPLFIMIALYMGARKEQITSLHWSQVDLGTRRINFAIEGRAQTKKRRPRLPIPERLLRFLRYAYARRSSDKGPVLHINGKAIKRVDKGFRIAARRAGLIGVSPHTLRHTRGTWMAQDGVSMWDIAGWLGQDPATTARIYAHHSPDFMQAALKSVDRR